MTPEDLQRIEEEERARFAVRQKLEAEQASAKVAADGQNVLSGCGILLAVCFVLWLGLTMFAPSCGGGTRKESFAELHGGAAYQDGFIVIVNRDAEPWREVRIEVNGQWELSTGTISSGATMKYLPRAFTRSDGTRLDPDTVNIQRIDIHASIAKGRGHWNGSY